MQTTVDLKELDRLLNTEHSDPFNILGMHPCKDKDGTMSGICVRAFLPQASSVRIIPVEVPPDRLTQTGACSTQTNTVPAQTDAVPAQTGVVFDQTVVVPDQTKPPQAALTNEKGFFEAFFPHTTAFFKYKLEITYFSGETYTVTDPYSFGPVISDYDLYLFNEGNFHKCYEKLGAHRMTIDDIEGTLFAVWAPCAKRVSVVGDFNRWDGRLHQMRRRGCSGVWEIFIPGLKQGITYKFEIKTQTGQLYIKSDPYAFYSELKPGTASIIYNPDTYRWKDDAWMSRRDNQPTLDKPVSIYEVHPGSWAAVPDEGYRPLTYREFARKLVAYVKYMGFTHIELMPVAEHPYDGSWGYQVTGYYSITSRFGKPEDFMYFVDECHQNGIGVLMDWVPAHFPKDGHGLARFDGTALYEHEDIKQGEHPDWGTHIFNYGRHEVKNFLISNAVFWLEKYHIDGLRVDAVASMLYLDYGKNEGEWVKNKWGGRENAEAIEFLRQLNTTVYKYFPGIMMVAEESTSWPMVTKPPYAGGLGFSHKWNMGWMNDYTRYISMDPIYRKHHQNNLTFSIMYTFSENFILPLSHDEVVHGKCSMINKMPGDYLQKFAGLRAAYGFMYGHPGKKLLFMGGEFGQFIEWDYKKSLDWHLLDFELHRKLQTYVRDLNHLYKNEKALYELEFSPSGFEWIDCCDTAHSVVCFIRKARDRKDCLLFVCSFTPVPHSNYRVGVPLKGFYEEVLNSDADCYGGSNMGNIGGVYSENCPCHNHPYSINLQLPSFGVLVLKPQLK